MGERDTVTGTHKSHNNTQNKLHEMPLPRYIYIEREREFTIPLKIIVSISTQSHHIQTNELTHNMIKWLQIYLLLV